MEKSQQQTEVQVKVPDHLRAPTYANMVNVNIEKTEVTFNFVYTYPQDDPVGTLVSRVVVPRNMLGQLRDLLVDLAEAVGGDAK